MDIDGFNGGVYAALYSPDDTWIATACGDGTVRLLDELYAERIRFADFEGEEWIAITPSNSGDINVVTMSLPAMNCGVSLVERRGGSLKPVDGFQQVVPPYFG